MLIDTMTIEECFAMLARTNIARLGCARNNQPYVVPLRVDLEGSALYGYATLGRKIEWMRTNALVCLEFEELTSPDRWATVVVFGVYEELPHTPENEAGRQVAERLFQKHPMFWEPAAVTPNGESRRPIVFRIHISSMTGRKTRDLAHSESPEEKPLAARAAPGWFTERWRRLRGSSAD